VDIILSINLSVDILYSNPYILFNILFSFLNILCAIFLFE